jgi:site-specific DNA recombinase
MSQRAALYTRTSAPNQRYNLSIPGQIDLCLKQCTQKGWTATYIFIDECRSGKNTDRERFKSMMDKAEKGLFDILVFWKLDRVFRSLADAVNSERVLRSYNVNLSSITEYIDTTTPVGRLNFRTLASVAEFEREIIGERARMGLYELARQRRWPNRSPPLGFDLDDGGSLEVNNVEARKLNEIYGRYNNIASMPKLAYELNQEDERTKIGGEWTVPELHKVLTNRLYVGEFRVAGYVEYVPEYRIIDQELFDSVQKIRSRYQYPGAEKKPVEADRRKAKMNVILEKYRAHLSSPVGR